jgi:hypothetical protein
VSFPHKYLIADDASTAFSRTIRALATLVSIVFHPVFMPVVMILLVYKLAPINFAGIPVGNIAQLGSLGNLLFIVGLLTVFFPLLSVLLMKKLGLIPSIEMHEAKDRILPLMAIMIFFFWANHVMGNLQPAPPFVVRLLILGCFWTVIALFMASIFFKISMHATAAGGMLGLFIVLLFINPIDMRIPLFIALILAGVIGTARLLLGAHRPGEVWAGYALGLAVQTAAYFYLT